VQLVVSDAHEGLEAAIRRVLGATWQRCRVHWMRSALAHVGKGQQSVVAAALRQAFLQADQASAHRVWRQVADQLRPRWPKLSALMDESGHDVLACLGFPAQHRAKPHSTDVLDKSFSAAVLWWLGTGDRVALSGAAAASLAGSPHPDDPAAVAALVRFLPGFCRHDATRCS
jgi:transposase-like protein